MSITASGIAEPRVSDPCQGLITHLVLRCGLGDETALGELFDLTFFVVAATVQRGVGSSTGVDDEVVEAFRRIWHRSATYEPDRADVLAWLLNQAVDRPSTEDDGVPVAHGLTERETSVLELVGSGLTNQDIADRLYLSVNTIKTYIRSAYRKIGVTRRTEAVLWAVHHDLTSAPSTPSGALGSVGSGKELGRQLHVPGTSRAPRFGGRAADSGGWA
jgi:DNA-binding CsgD family transcriptional regulator